MNEIDLGKGGDDWKALYLALLAEREATLGIRASMAIIASTDLD